ncbi:MAG TPA: anti-sigma factor [Solirubrobacterales bacterium]|nr:anti-sigma factor [Solirubrobacterales bacterium]
MSGRDGHEHWSDDLAAYMLGALEPAEAAAFEHHLQGCERCRAELRWLEPAVGTLPEAVARHEPPRALRASLMAEVRAEAGAGSATAPRPRSRPAPPRLRFAGAFAAIVLLVAGVAGYELGRNGSGGGGEPSTIVSRQPDGITVKMVREGSGGTLHLANVRQLPADKVLEAWVRREGEVEPVPALFVPDSRGRAETTIADMSGVDTVMVTAEPRGGSPEPTSEPIVTMSVSSITD